MGKNNTCPNKTNSPYDLYCDSCDPDGDNVEGTKSNYNSSKSDYLYDSDEEYYNEYYGGSGKYGHGDKYDKGIDDIANKYDMDSDEVNNIYEMFGATP